MNKHDHKIITCISMLLAAICLLSAVPALSSTGTVKVGCEVDFQPFAFVDDKGQATGFSVELIKAVAEVMEIPLEIHTGSWDSMWDGLVSGRLGLLPVVAKMPNRVPLVDFSLSHTETFDAFFTRSGSPELQTIASAEGKTIVVMRSDAAHHALLARNFRGRIITVDTIPDGMDLIASGKHDAFLCPKLIGILILQNKNLKGLSAGPPLKEYKRDFAFAVNKGTPELLEKLNQGLLIIKSNGEYARLYDKWLGNIDPWKQLKKRVLLVLCGAAAALIFVGIWVVMLRRTVRKRTAEREIVNHELQQQSRLIISVFNSTPDVIFIKDMEGKYVLVNQAMTEFLGKNSVEIIGRDDIFIFPEVVAARLMRDDRQILADRAVTSYEEVFPDLSGNQVTFQTTKGCLIDEYGNPFGIYGLLRDITDRKRMEQALCDREELFRSMFEMHGAVMMLVDPSNGDILDANRSAAAFYGYERDLLKTMHISQINCLRPEQIASEMSKALEGTKNNFVFPHRRANGNICTVELHSTAINLNGKQLLFSIINDISEKLLTQNKLEASEEQLRHVLAGTNDGFWDWNIASGEVDYSERWGTMLGYEISEIVPNISTWEKLVHPDDMVGIREALNAHLEGITPAYQSEHRLLHKNGTWIWILDRGKVVERDVNGTPLRAAGTHTNIHEKHIAQESLLMMQAHLEELVDARTNALKDSLEQLQNEVNQRSKAEKRLKSLSIKIECEERIRISRDIHDGIGQSLHAIKFGLKMLEQDCLSVTHCNNVESISDLIADISSVSEELREIIVALNPMILRTKTLDDAISWLCTKTQLRREIKISFEKTGEFSAIDSNIKLVFFRICQEAINNALKHSNATTLSVRIFTGEQMLSLSIKDNGCGGVQYVDVAYPNDSSGISIMHERMKLIQGSLTITSPAGGGTTLLAEVSLQ